MRLLLHSETGSFSLTKDLVGDDPIPPYAILSHTWGPDTEEVTFEDMRTGTGEKKPGYEKIRFCGEQARTDALQYFWIDTCCIDKSNSTELQEAINSMFRWYRDAAKCYVYLSDVLVGKPTQFLESFCESAFNQSRWFTRGWTLQELIAPKHVDFFSQDGTHLGNKSTLETSIFSATGISLDVLRGCPLADFTIEERLTWAEGRTTKREEDRVYSLFGIFDVTMPLVYGEGKAKALRRFYDEISRYTYVADPSCIDDTQELVVLLQIQTAVQRLEARLTTPLVTRSNSLGLQGSSTTPATYQSIWEHKERLIEVTNAVGMATESVDANPPTLLRSLLLKLLSAFTAPFGYFETLFSFFPETYTPYDFGPQLICYSFVLDEKHPTAATFTQDLLVAKTQRHWVRIKLRITAFVGTTHWKLIAEYTQGQVSYIGWRQLPKNVILLVQKLMIEHPDISDGTEIGISFNNNANAISHDDNPKAISLTRMLNASIIDQNWNFTESLRHQNVRMIPDMALVTAYLLGTSLVANLDNRWVLYRNASSNKLEMEFLWRTVRTSVILRDAPHVAQLVGVVVDYERKLFKGTLTELPPKGPLFQLMEAHKVKGKPIAWPIRQKWAKQIVRGVAAFHERCQVIGGLRTYNSSVCIDEHDDVMFLVAFSQGSHPAVHAHGGLLPPEYRTEAFEKGDGQVGPEFDVFQLGGLLWHLYRDQDQQGPKTFCSLAGCNNATLAACDKHEYPIALPRAATDIPDYLDRIIALCRQENPRKRPAAWELIHMFPTDEEISREIELLGTNERVISGDHSATAANAKLSRLEVVRELYGLAIICTRCSKRCHDVYYSCEYCHCGNYDQCHGCFVEGRHCFDKTHFLARYNLEALANKDYDERVTYYSSVNEEGRREEIVI